MTFPANIPEDEFPIKLEWLHPDTREVVDSMVLDASVIGTTFAVAPIAKLVGHPVALRLTFADGVVMEAGPHVFDADGNPVPI